MSKKPKKFEKIRSPKVEIRWNRWRTYGCEVRDGDFRKDIWVSILLIFLQKYRYYIDTNFRRYFPSLTVSFLKYRLFATKHAKILSTYFLWWFQIPLLECIQRSSGFPGSPGHLFQNSSYAVHVLATENQILDGARSRLYGGCFIISMLWCSSHSCARAATICDRESFVEEILIISTGYDSEVFPVPSCNNPYLSAFLEGKYVDRPSLGNRRRRPTSLYSVLLLMNVFVLDSPLWTALLTHILF